MMLNGPGYAQLKELADDAKWTRVCPVKRVGGGLDHDMPR